VGAPEGDPKFSAMTADKAIRGSQTARASVRVPPASWQAVARSKRRKIICKGKITGGLIQTLNEAGRPLLGKMLLFARTAR
jgi:hypothetical protein